VRLLSQSVRAHDASTVCSYDASMADKDRCRHDSSIVGTSSDLITGSGVGSLMCIGPIADANRFLRR